MRSAAVLLLALSFARGRADADEAIAPFQLHAVASRAFQAVRVWAPPAGSTGKYETIVLLHGNQPGAPDPTWMVGLRFQPAFARRILIVPAIADGGYEFGSPTTARALAALVDEVARRFPVDRDALYLVGYSAGASRVLPVALRLGRVNGIAAVAGDVARPLRDHPPSLAALAAVPLL